MVPAAWVVLVILGTPGLFHAQYGAPISEHFDSKTSPATKPPTDLAMAVRSLAAMIAAPARRQICLIKHFAFHGFPENETNLTSIPLTMQDPHGQLRRKKRGNLPHLLSLDYANRPEAQPSG